MAKDKIKLQKGTAQETLIIPLYARKKCSDKFPDLYYDPIASSVCESLDYDFSELDKKYDSFAYEFGAMEGAMRQLDMMCEVNDYLKDHPKASIVCLGCGLDFDPRRCGDKNNKIYNIDFENIIKARKEFVKEDKRETNIASDLMDFSWMDKIDTKNGAVIYAAGVFYYLEREDVKKMIIEMSNRFKGCRLVFDTVGALGYKIMMKEILKNHGIKDFGDLFYSGNAVEELSKWSNNYEISSKGYMLGYYDMKKPKVTGLHRFLAWLGDNVMKMQIVCMNFK